MRRHGGLMALAAIGAMMAGPTIVIRGPGDDEDDLERMRREPVTPTEKRRVGERARSERIHVGNDWEGATHSREIARRQRQAARREARRAG